MKLEMLDLLIGLVFVYFALSIVCSALLEALSGWFNMRGKFLSRGIQTMLGEEQPRAISNLLPKGKDHRAPPAPKLTTALMDDPEIKGLSTKNRHPSYLKPEVFAGALLRTAENKGALAHGLPETIAQGLERANLGNAGKVLAQIYRDTGGSPASVQKAVVDWYNSSMERVSGWYKRWTMNVLIVVGLFVAIGTNADTIRIIQILSTDSEVRASLVALANEAEPFDPDTPKNKEDPKPPQGPPSDPAAKNAPIAADAPDPAAKNAEDPLPPQGPPSTPGTEPTQTDVDAKNRTSEARERAKQELLKIGPLIGWTEGQWKDMWKSTHAAISKILGITITALAITFGAPFWFDVLKKLANLRSSLAPSDKRADDGGGSQSAQPAPTDPASPGAPPTPSGTDSPSLPAYARGMVGFIPHTAKPTPINIQWLAHWSHLAYQPEAAVADHAAPLGMNIRFHTSPPTTKKDAQAYTIFDRDTIIIAFRGTEPRKPADWLADATFLPEPWLTNSGKAHKGIAAYLDSIWPDIKSTLTAIRTSGQSVWLTGHSLGGAMAVLAASRLSAELPDISIRGVATFGQPRVGDADFARIYNAALGDRTIRCISNRDIVTRVPQRIAGFRDVGSVWYFDERGRFCGDPGFFFRFLDTVVVTREEFNAAAKEGIADHAMALYVDLCKAHAEQHRTT